MERRPSVDSLRQLLAAADAVAIALDAYGRYLAGKPIILCVGIDDLTHRALCIKVMDLEDAAKGIGLSGLMLNNIQGWSYELCSPLRALVDSPWYLGRELNVPEEGDPNRMMVRMSLSPKEHMMLMPKFHDVENDEVTECYPPVPDLRLFNMAREDLRKIVEKAPPDALENGAANEPTRPAFKRDQYLLKVLEELGDANDKIAKVRDHWNELPEAQRQQIAPDFSRKLGTGKAGSNLVRKAIDAAKHDLEKMTQM